MKSFFVFIGHLIVIFAIVLESLFFVDAVYAHQGTAAAWIAFPAFWLTLAYVAWASSARDYE